MFKKLRAKIKARGEIISLELQECELRMSILQTELETCRFYDAYIFKSNLNPIKEQTDPHYLRWRELIEIAAELRDKHETTLSRIKELKLFLTT